jgi:hypothetical protein
MVSNEQPGGCKRLNEAALLPGDIILTTTTAATSKTIRAATRSDISHALIYAEDYSVIDATDEGVHSRNTQRLHFEEECSVYALRLRSRITAAQVVAVLTFVRSHIGTEYSVREAVRTVVGSRSEWSTKQFCSRLVAQAFSSAGIVLVKDPNYCSPSDLQLSELLERVPDATVIVKDGEAEFWESRVDIPQLMRDATNALLDGARKSDANIQTLNDLDLYLAYHPEKDTDFSRLLIASGYLTIWEIEKNKNPWQYDFGIMQAESEGGLVDYCRNVLHNEGAAPNRYVVNRGGYRVLVANYELKYFHLMLELYEQLATLHRQRVDVATEWLQANGYLEKHAISYLIPHTPEWFEALQVWDPPQADMVRAVIGRENCVDICSICGDSPAGDHYLPKAFRSAGGVDTFRLCADCVRIRRASGEPFLPLSHATGG